MSVYGVTVLRDGARWNVIVPGLGATHVAAESGVEGAAALLIREATGDHDPQLVLLPGSTRVHGLAALRRQQPQPAE